MTTPTELEKAEGGAVASNNQLGDNLGQVYNLTPKGYFSIRAGIKFEDVDDIWNDLVKFVAEQARINGMDEGVPCLVMVEGGHCITVTKNSDA